MDGWERSVCKGDGQKGGRGMKGIKAGKADGADDVGSEHIKSRNCSYQMSGI